MFRCSKSNCPWACGNGRNNPCVDRIVASAMAAMLWLVLAGSILAGILSLRASQAAL